MYYVFTILGTVAALVAAFLFGMKLGRRGERLKWLDEKLKTQERIQNANEQAAKLEKETDKKVDDIRNHRTTLADNDRGMSGDDGWNTDK